MTRNLFPILLSTNRWRDPADVDGLLDAVRRAAIDIVNAAN